MRIDQGMVDKVDQLEQSLEELSSMPDRFNDLFADRGWVAYDGLNTELSKKAVEIGEAGDIDAAEKLLVEHFDEKTIDWGIKFLWAIEAFRPRERLARLALDDYLQERYHACTPVLLLIIDGFVNDVTKSKGFFAEGTDLIAWDSIAAHDRGLQTLAKLWRAGRNKTTTETLSLPYRHGILHGRDLGYDNRLVAAKLWAGLFALKDWAIAVRDGRLEEPPPKPKPSWSEIAQQKKQLDLQKGLLDEWKPRTEEELAKIPKTGAPEAYEVGSPERAVADLMALWSRDNYGHMAHLTHLPLDEPLDKKGVGRVAKQLRELLGDKKLLDFEFLEIQDKAAAISNARVQVRWKRDGKEEIQVLKLGASYLTDDGPAPRGFEGGRWTLQNLWGAVSSARP